MSIFQAIEPMAVEHPAWSNAFFRRAQRGLSRRALRVVCPEYLHFTAAFPAILSQLIARVDERTRFHLVAILFSEMGSGDESTGHANLFRRLCRDVGLTDDEIAAPAKRPETAALTSGLHELYGSAALAESLGAQYVLEYQAENMLKSFRRAFSVLDPGQSPSMSAGMAFFSVHDKEEPEHIAAMRVALFRSIESDEDEVAAIAGARRCLDLFGGFWAGLESAVAEIH